MKTQEITAKVNALVSELLEKRNVLVPNGLRELFIFECEWRKISVNGGGLEMDQYGFFGVVGQWFYI